MELVQSTLAVLFIAGVAILLERIIYIIVNKFVKKEKKYERI